MVKGPCELTNCKDLFGWYRRLQTRKTMCRGESTLMLESFGVRKAILQLASSVILGKSVFPSTKKYLPYRVSVWIKI